MSTLRLPNHISPDDYTQERERCRQHTDSELIMFALAELLHAMPNDKKQALTVALQDTLMDRTGQ